MFKLLVMLIAIASAPGCVKQEPAISDEVILSIANECRATIKLYNYDSGKQYLSDMFDCSYVSILALKIQPGKYKVKAETFRGKVVEKIFTKGPYAQDLYIEF